MASISPSPDAAVQQDLPSPGVREDFRVRRRFNKSREKYGLGFWAKRRRLYKVGLEAVLEGKMGIGGTPG
jgi:hypothetical protein